MSDIDFDELDKAVNSIIGRKKSNDTSSIESNNGVSNTVSTISSQQTTTVQNNPDDASTDNTSSANLGSWSVSPQESTSPNTVSYPSDNASPSFNQTTESTEVDSSLNDSSEIQVPPSVGLSESEFTPQSAAFSVPEPTPAVEVEEPTSMGSQDDANISPNPDRSSTETSFQDKTILSNPEASDTTPIDTSPIQRPRRGRFMDIKPSQQASGRPLGVSSEDTGASDPVEKPLDLAVPAARRHSLVLDPVNNTPSVSPESDQPTTPDSTVSVQSNEDETATELPTISQDDMAALTNFGKEDTGTEDNIPASAPIVTDTAEPVTPTDTSNPYPETVNNSVDIIDQPNEFSTEDSYVNSTLENTPVSEAATSSESEQPESLSSPFIPDAKVEKRPLGAPDQLFVSPENTGPASSTSDELMDMEDSLPARPQDLKNEPAMAVSGYQPQPTTINEKPSGAVYDTDDYHQPLNHPVKKKSGWLVIVWILVALIIGSIGGAAYFYFTNTP